MRQARMVSAISLQRQTTLHFCSQTRTLSLRSVCRENRGFHRLSLSSFSGTSSSFRDKHTCTNETIEAQRRRQAATTRHVQAVSRQPEPQQDNHRSTPDNDDGNHSCRADPQVLLTCADLETIPGFFEPQLLNIYRTLHDTQRTHRINGHVAEIGVYHGRSFLPLVEMVCSSSPTDEIAMAIDCFESQQYNRDSSGEGNYSRFERHLAQYGLGVDQMLRKEEGQSPDWATSMKQQQQQKNDEDNTTTTTNHVRIVALQADSLTLTKNDLEDVVRTATNHNNREDHNIEHAFQIRFFSLDGSHTEEAVMSDLSLAHSCVGAGGIVALDDALNPDWPGVTSGLSRYLMRRESTPPENDLLPQSSGLSPFAFGYNKCFLSTGDPWNTLYRNALQPYERKQSTFWNCPVSILPQGFIASHFGND